MPIDGPRADRLRDALQLERTALRHRDAPAGANDAAQRVADQQLTRAGLPCEAARDVHGAANELVVVRDRLSGVNADTDPQRRCGIAPVAHVGSPKDRDGAIQGDRRRVEHHIEGVAFGLDLGAVVTRDLAANERSVVAQ